MKDSTKENKYEENSSNESVFTFDDEEEQSSKLNDKGFVFDKTYETVETPTEQNENYVDTDEFITKLSKKAGDVPEGATSFDLNAHFEEQSSILQSGIAAANEAAAQEETYDFNEDDKPYYDDEPEESEISDVKEEDSPAPKQIQKKDDSFWDEEETNINVSEHGVGTRNEKLKKLQASAVNEDSLWNRSKEAFDKVFENDSIDKKRSILGLDFKFWKIFILLFYAADVVFYNFAVYKVAYPLIENIAKSLGIEALKQASYEKYYVMFSYIVAFLVGGALLMILMKLARRLLDGVGTHESVLLVRMITMVVLVVFLVGSIIMGISKGFLVAETYRWAAPCIAYIAGILGDFWF